MRVGGVSVRVGGVSVRVGGVSVRVGGVSVRVGGVSVKKRVGCNGRSQRLKICSVCKVVEMNKIIIFCNVQ